MPLRARVHDDIAEQVRVDAVARRERDVEDVLGDAADRHGGSGDLYRPPMPDEPVLTERRDGVLLITLNRPDARNAVNLALAEGIAAALDELDADGDARVGVLTGAGTGFCAGMDLKAFVTGERPWVGDRGFAGHRPARVAQAAHRGRSRASRWPAAWRSRWPAT